MRKLLLPLLLALTCAAPAARAQWESVTYSLKGGWNAIYLHGDASHATPEVHFAANPEVLEVWRWNPNPTQTQFESSPLIPTPGTADWSVWTRGATSGNTLTALVGQTAYLVRCAGTESSGPYLVTIVQKALPPRGSWVRNGANLLGFPARLEGTFPTLQQYFATFPAAIAANTRIYKYVGGVLGPNNPVEVFSTSSEPLDRNQAYWFEAPVVSTFYAPLEFSVSHADGFAFGRAGSLITLRVRNRTNTGITLTTAPVTPTSELVATATRPAGQPDVEGPVPITLITRNAAGEPVGTLISTGFERTIGPQASITLEFGIDRTQMSGTPGAFYASLLRFTDSATASSYRKLVDVRLPVTALVPSLAGLWVGDIAVSNVGNKSPAAAYLCEVTGPKSKLDSRAVAAGTNTLSPLTRPPEGGPYTYRWKKNGALLAGETSATLTLSTVDAAASGAFGGATSRPASLRTLLHVSSDVAGTARLLPQVFLGKLEPAPHDFGLCTRESGLDQTARATATRLTAVHLPADALPAVGVGTVALPTGPVENPVYSSLVCTIPLEYRNASNPFVHTYHPDHDNKDARGTALAEGIESYSVTRVCTFTFTGPPAGLSSGWGSSILGGTYTEVITGLHRDPLTVTGTFLLRRVSEIGTITVN